MLLVSAVGGFEDLCANIAGVWHSVGGECSLCSVWVKKLCVEVSFGEKSVLTHVLLSVCPAAGCEDVKSSSVTHCVIGTSRCWQKAFVKP